MASDSFNHSDDVHRRKYSEHKLSELSWSFPTGVPEAEITLHPTLACRIASMPQDKRHCPMALLYGTSLQVREALTAANR